MENKDKWQKRADKLDEVANSMDKVGKGMEKVGKKLTLAITIPIVLTIFFGFYGLIAGIIIALFTLCS